MEQKSVKMGRPKKYYAERMAVRFDMDVELVGKLDEIALSDETSRTTIAIRAITQYIKKRGL